MFFSKKQVFSIEGMKCEHCAQHVTDAIKAIGGVKDCKVDLTAKTATVKSKDGIAEDLVKAAVEKLGFTYKGLIA